MDGKVTLDLKDYERLKRFKELAKTYIEAFAEIEQLTNDSKILSITGDILEDWHS